MKRFTQIFAIALAVLCVASCQKKEEIIPVFPNPVTKVLEANGVFTLEFTPNVDWSLELLCSPEDQSWFWIQDNNSKVYNLRGAANEKVSLKVCTNNLTDDKEHKCELVLKMNDQKKTIATISRDFLVRKFSLALCKIIEYAGTTDYEANEDPDTDLQFTYNSVIASNGTIELVKISGARTFGFRRGVLVDADFSWKVLSKPEWLGDPRVVEGGPGQVEIELEAEPSQYPLDGASGEIVFCAQDNEEAVFKYNISVPACKDIFEIVSQKEIEDNGKGDTYIANVLSLENISLYALSKSSRWEESSWIELSLSDWNSKGGVLQDRELSIIVSPNDAAAREAYVFAMPADKAPANPASIMGSSGINSEYQSYLVSHIMQADKPASITVLDETAMTDAGASFEKETKETWVLNSFKVKEAFRLTYTNEYSADGAILLAAEEHEDITFTCYDFDGMVMAEEESWLEAQNLGFEKGAFKIFMYPEKDKFGNEASMNLGVDHEGFIVLSDKNGAFAVIVCIYNEESDGEEQNSVSFAFEGQMTIQDADLIRVNADNMAELSALDPDKDLNLSDFFNSSKETYVLTYDNADVEDLAVLKIPEVLQWTVKSPDSTPWFSVTETADGLKVSMDSPEEDDQKYGILQMYPTGMTQINIICIPLY